MKILNLPHNFEILIVGSKDLFLMNQEGEKLFNLERSFKIQGRKVVSNLINMDFLSDGAVFEQYATSGRCPRRLVAYNEQTARKIANSYSFRSKVSAKFGIELNQDDKLCINSKEDAERLVDILCGRATTDFLTRINRCKWTTRKHGEPGYETAIIFNDWIHNVLSSALDNSEVVY